MQKNLVIVESPAKAKTIQQFLGKDFQVMSSYGHIRDLKKREFSIDLAQDFKPIYEIPKEKRELVGELKKASQEASTVWLASDEDREGEAIAWHLSEVLELKPEHRKRIVFHEITKPAILHAIGHPREIDINLVNAQQARRVLDRIVGFELSPVLWRKVKPALSAGRVQSVAVRLIVEREREIQQFQSESFYRVSTTLAKGDGSELRADLNTRFPTESEACGFLDSCAQARLTIEEVTRKPLRKQPAPPFTTSTLQQEAARKLGFSVSRTMSVAQKLYESGQITYMRTDSVNLSELAINACKETIHTLMGAKYHRARRYETHTKGAQEAHEAIRPTYMDRQEIEGNPMEKRLYALIWKRTIASQMAEAETEKTTAYIAIDNRNEKFVATGEVVKFDGFLRVYKESFDEETDSENESGALPPLEKGETLSYKAMTATQKATQHPPRYTEASLVHKLEELGIGRPSTYAPTISTIQQRGYVLKGDKPGVERSYKVFTLEKGAVSSETHTEMNGQEKGKLIPTDTGLVVNDFLMEYFPAVLDYNFTANVEKEFDEVAEGHKPWTSIMNDFYTHFHPLVTSAMETKMEHKVGERELGTDPKTGRTVYVKIGRFGPVVQIGQATDEEKPIFAQLKPGLSLETVTLEEALELFKLPRTVGKFEGKPVVIGAGRFGPYVRHDGKFYSIGKEKDPLTMNLSESVALILTRREAEKRNHLKKFDERPGLEVMNGRFGPYISCDGNNYKLPKNTVPTSLTLEECLSIIQQQQEKKATTHATRGKRATTYSK